MKWHRLFLWATAVALIMGCSVNNEGNIADEPDIPTTPENPVIPTQQTPCVGADLSQWLAYKNGGAEWRCNGTTIENVPAFFSENGYNATRLRLFVNPDTNTTACQSLDYVIESAQAMRDAGMDICIDFHYSDTWADPGKQTIPEAWKGLDATALASQLYQYTRDCLTALKNCNITPTLIQIGNEITAGMLWNTGRIDVWGGTHDNPTQWKNFLALMQNATKACREVFPTAKVVVHIDRGGDAETAQRYYKRIAEVDYDIIGLSYYPYWHGTLAQLEQTLLVLTSQFPEKKIMIMETGIGYNEWSDDSATAQYGNYPSTPQGQEKFMNDLVTLLNQYEQVSGVFYWFPEETKIDWQCKHRIDLNRGLFDRETSEVLPAFYSLPQFYKIL